MYACVYADVSGQVTKETTKLTKNKDVVKNYSYDSADNKSAFKVKVGDATKLSLSYEYPYELHAEWRIRHKRSDDPAVKDDRGF